MARLALIHGNLMECQKKILKRQLNQTATVPTFVDHNLSPDINFNGYCLTNTISIPKKVINL